MQIKKNNGKYQEFSKEKIINSVLEAAKSVNEDVPFEFAESVASSIERTFDNGENITALNISELVENKLMNSRFKNTARAYIRYRYNAEKERVNNSQLLKAFRKKLDGTNIENQNANSDENSFSGRINEASRILLKNDALTNRMSRTSRNNHNNNEIYEHDLDSFSVGLHNCLSIPFDRLLEKGFTTKQADVRSPRSINTFGQLIAVLMQLQSLNQFGGVSATHLDWTGIPYVRYSFAKHYRDGMKYIMEEDWVKPSDSEVASTSIESDSYKANKRVYNYALDMTKKDIHQGMEALYHNLK